MTKVNMKNVNKLHDKLRNDADHLTNDKEVRSLSKYVRSRGEYRSGLTTGYNGGALVPSQIIHTGEDLTRNRFDLSKYVTNIPVSTNKGDYPVMSPNQIAETKEELAKYPDVDSDIQTVPFKIQTYAGRIQLSNELLEDSDETALMPELSKDLSTIMINTKSKAIMDKLSTLNSTTINSVDDLINAIESVDPRFQTNIFVGQGAYSKLLSMKDKNGDYLLRPANNTFLGLKIVVLPSYIGDTNSVFVGDMGVACAMFTRLQTTLSYNNNNLFAQSLAAILRFDVELTYSDAIKHLTFGNQSK